MLEKNDFRAFGGTPILLGVYHRNVSLIFWKCLRPRRGCLSIPVFFEEMWDSQKQPHLYSARYTHLQKNTCTEQASIEQKSVKHDYSHRMRSLTTWYVPLCTVHRVTTWEGGDRAQKKARPLFFRSGPYRKVASVSSRFRKSSSAVHVS